jgi:hypothetical protein
VLYACPLYFCQYTDHTIIVQLYLICEITMSKTSTNIKPEGVHNYCKSEIAQLGKKSMHTWVVRAAGVPSLRQRHNREGRR